MERGTEKEIEMRLRPELCLADLASLAMRQKMQEGAKENEKLRKTLSVGLEEWQ
jgi:hypothetical protein